MESATPKLSAIVTLTRKRFLYSRTALILDWSSCRNCCGGSVLEKLVTTVNCCCCRSYRDILSPFVSKDRTSGDLHSWRWERKLFLSMYCHSFASLSLCAPLPPYPPSPFPSSLTRSSPKRRPLPCDNKGVCMLIRSRFILITPACFVTGPRFMRFIGFCRRGVLVFYRGKYTCR